MVEGQELLAIPSARFTCVRKLAPRIFVASDRVMKTAVVVKQIMKTLRTSCSALNEYLLGKQLCHPYIIRAIECIEMADCTLLVQEYANGGDLYSLIAPGKTGPSMPMAQSWMLQTAEALCYLHEKGFVHRDVKPENLLVHNDSIRLCDFGLTCMEGTTCGSKGPGTLPYMAPEAHKAHSVTAAQDVWSLGIVLFAILFADLPWEAAVETDSQYVRYLKTGQLGSLGVAMLSKSMISMLTRMLEPAAEHRATMRDVVDFFSASRPWFVADGSKRAVACPKTLLQAQAVF